MKNGKTANPPLKKTIPKLKTATGTTTFHVILATKDGKVYAKSVK